MAEVILSVGGYSYKMACRDGEEPHLQKLAAAVDTKVKEAQAAVGNTSEIRQLLFAALLFADESLEPAKAQISEPADPAHLDALAAKLENLAQRLETSP
jgi:cell division protein ZapA